MKRTIITSVLAGIFVFSGFAEREAGQGHDNMTKEKFVTESYSRLSAKTADLEPIKEKAKHWSQTRSEKDWVAVTESIHQTAVQVKSTSIVTVTTPKAPGATVKYQTLGERKRGQPPLTANGLTSLKQDMPIGVYHIWSERGGNPTSNRDAQFEIVKATATVELPEP